MSHEGYQPLDIFHIYNTPATGVVLQMTATGAVKGQVVRAGGAGGEVYVTRIRRDHGGAHWEMGRVDKVKADGTFEFKDVPPGTYVITVLTVIRRRDRRISLAKTITVKMGGNHGGGASGTAGPAVKWGVEG